MKNKILLTLVLLIPSLCFGEAIGIFIKHNKEEQITAFVINGTSFPKKIFKFRTFNNKIYRKDNLSEYTFFLKFFLSLCPKEVDTCFKDSILKEDNFDYVALCALVEHMFIKNNFALTYRELDFADYEATYHYYKEDK